MFLLCSILLLVASALALPPVNNGMSLAPALPTNLTSHLNNPLPPPECYAGVRVLTKPILRAQKCEPIFDWIMSQDIFRRIHFEQTHVQDIHTFPPLEAGVQHAGCEIEVYSRVAPAHATFTLSDIQQAAKHVIEECEHVRLGGRGGKSAILSRPRGIIPGWFVKVETKVRVEAQ